MSLPSSNDLLTMDFGMSGQPAVLVPTTNIVDTLTMDYAQDGIPFVTNPSVSGPLKIGGWDGVTAANIQALMGTTYTNIQSIYGVS